ncbi:MAG: potassium channel protein [Marinilabiliales bacterium]|nr:MAG: potassium channel protein [Marinilabiliales bacterium]
MDKDSARNLILAGIYLIGIVLTGIFGFMLIDDFSLINAMYMTVITVSTVGFREAQPLSDGGKLFTSFLILASLGVLTYFITSITQSLFKSQMSFFYPGFSKRKKNAKMENHVVVVGYGRNGDQVVKELMAFGSNVVVIDENHEIVINNIGRPIRFIEGNATDDEILIKADVKSARALITTLPNDADNLFVVLTARALNPALKIISRASSDSAEKKLRMAGVDSVVLPERVGGAHMATLVAQPDIVEFLEHLTLHSDTPTQLMEIACHELPEGMRNKPIRDFAIRRKSGANIIGMKTAQGELIMNPSPDTKLIPESKLFVLGTIEQIDDLKELLQEES